MTGRSKVIFFNNKNFNFFLNNGIFLEYLRNYLHQMREETGQRICQRVFKDEQCRPSKWWTCFAKRKFLNLNLQEIN